ncbi:aminotransferase [Paenibacillus sp. VTT E-133280]|jgi:2-aminoadipate transaminase|uniref:aminotransferase-like domain-containing protein n=1 Tax=unclassified Paenibacillus TaxID=185978 RepID=UPI000BA08C10|nr:MULTISPECIES: PLP-dependent aminotransferase family protein [unclassified Paenibacillus]MDH6370097.1 2-aminoadipate transaminase [Paenibacillus sp. PastF-3]OZQ66362.1 aminotransferase [Paenibacillus sp. VTT E-133280]OZQ93128.1 aminotransferase [Paenibacillus sp. VTT E-133291]
MDIKYSTAANHLGSSAVREILKVTQGNDIISLAGGLPGEDLFPLEAVRDAYNRVLSSDTSVLQYGLTEGFTPLRDKIAERLTRQGIPVTASEMILTTGSQQAIDLLCKILLDPGDAVLVEAPTYLAALQVLGSYRADIHTINNDEQGMLPDHLEDQIQKLRPKLLYAVPTFNNPSGATWSKERREKVVEICRRYNVLILEDNPYGEITFEENKDLYPPSLASIDRSYGGDYCVAYTGTFSKIVAPALRTGWIIGDSNLIKTIAKAKQAADLHSSTIDQRALDELLLHFDIEQHIRVISREYYSRMKLLSAELRSQNWEGAHFLEPRGGMFLWLTLSQEINTKELLPLAVENGVAFVPGEVFYSSQPHKNKMRLNFTHTPPKLVPVAVQRLEKALVQWRESQAGIRS